LLFVSIAIIVTGFGIHFQIKSVSLPTDENLFSDPPSKIINTVPIKGFQKDGASESEDEIPAGSLIVSINDEEITDLKSLSQTLQNSKSHLKVKFYDRDKNLYRSIFVVKQNLALQNLRYLNSAVIIFWVKKGGASEAAGLKPGDIILSINNQEFANSLEADKILINASADKPIHYEVLRGADTLGKNVQLATINISFTTVFRYFISAIFLFFALFLGLRHSDTLPIQLLASAFLLLSWVLLSNFSRGDEDFLIGKFWKIVIAFSLSFSFGFFAHFLLYFPVQQVKLIARRHIVWGIYIISAFVFSALLFSYFTKSDYLTNILSNFAFVPVVGYRIVLNLLYKKVLLADTHKIGKKLLSYFWIVLFLILLSLFVVKNFPSLSNLFYYLFYSSIAVLPIFLFITINKYNLYGLSYRIRKSILYIGIKFLAETMFIFVMVFVLYGLSFITIKFPNLHLAGTRIEVLNTPLPPEKNQQYEKVAIILVFLLFVVLALQTRQKINHYLTKKFYRTKFDYKKTATELSELIVRNIGLKELAKNVVRELENTMLLKKACLMIFQNQNLCCIEFFNESDTTLISAIKENYRLIYEDSLESKGLTTTEAIKGTIGTILRSAEYIFFIPIKYNEKLIGTLLLGEKLSDTKFTYEDANFLEIITKNIAIAITNSFYAEELARQERYKQELEIAQKIQLASLPKEMPHVKGLSLAAHTIPALEVGGDFFDFLQNGEKFTVVVGDVSGKGTSAALYMSKIQGILRTLNEFSLSLKDLLLKTNQLLIENIEKNYFISTILCQFDPARYTASLVRAGHLGLYFFENTTGTVKKILPKGVVLGVISGDLFENTLETYTFNYTKGDIFVFVTDGVLEQLINGNLVDKEDKLIRVITEYSHLDANSLSERILTEVCFDNGTGELFDDVTIVVVKPE